MAKQVDQANSRCLCERRKSKALALGARGPQFESGRPDQPVRGRTAFNSPGALALVLAGAGRRPGVQKQVLLRDTISEASALSKRAGMPEGSHRHPGPVLRRAVAVRAGPGTSPVTVPAARPS